MKSVNSGNQDTGFICGNRMLAELSIQQNKANRDRSLGRQVVWDLSKFSELRYAGQDSAREFISEHSPSEDDIAKIVRFAGYDIIEEYQQMIIHFIQHRLNDVIRSLPDYSGRRFKALAGIDNRPFPTEFATSIIALGSGDGKKSAALYQSLVNKMHSVKLRFVDSSMHMLEAAMNTAGMMGIKAEAEKFTFDDLIDGIKTSVVYQDNPAISMKGSRFDVSRLENRVSAAVERESEIMKAGYHPHPRPESILFDHELLPEHLDNKGVLHFNTYLFLGRTLGNEIESYRLLDNIFSLLNPYDLLILEIDVKKSLEMYKVDGPFFLEYLKHIGINKEHVSDGNWKLDYEAVLEKDAETGRQMVAAYFTLHKGLDVNCVALEPKDKIRVFISKEYFAEKMKYFKSGSLVVGPYEDCFHEKWESKPNLIRLLHPNAYLNDGSTILIGYGGLGLADPELNQALLKGQEHPSYLSW